MLSEWAVLFNCLLSRNAFQSNSAFAFRRSRPMGWSRVPTRPVVEIQSLLDAGGGSVAPSCTRKMLESCVTVSSTPIDQGLVGSESASAHALWHGAASAATAAA